MIPRAISTAPWRGTMARGWLCAALILVSACTSPVGEIPGSDKTATDAPVRLSAVKFSDLPGWTQDSVAKALPALARSCALLAKRDASTAVTPAPIGGRVGDWLPSCNALPTGSPTEGSARAYLEAWFQPYLVRVGTTEKGLFTGYYEPEIAGSIRREGGFEVPLYRRPADLVQVELGKWRKGLRGKRIAGRVKGGRLVPYDSRAEIAAGSLVGRAEPLAWLADPIDAFFLHIQGSGRVRLADGRVLRVGYDGQNGHAYFAIGRHLIEKGHVRREDMSMAAIRTWLADHPEQMRAVMNRNPSFIFFRENQGEGPLGAQGVPLTPGRSLAVDRTQLPLGAPIWLVADHGDETGRKLARLMVAQDTGGAIQGAIRGDVFWGHGPQAADLAGGMAAEGSLYLILPRSLSVALAN